MLVLAATARRNSDDSAYLKNGQVLFFEYTESKSVCLWMYIGAIKHISTEIQACSVSMALLRHSGLNLGILFSNLKHQNITEICKFLFYPF